MPNGYWGRVLFVDLSTSEIRTATLPMDDYRHYLGGYGLGARVLYQHIPVGADPLGPENMLAFLPGLLTGTGAPFSGRFMVAAKSPLTGGWGDANCGGKFGPALRGAGYDGLFVRGASTRPVYLYVDEDGAELRDASHFWGRDTVDTEAAIQGATAPTVRVACVGPAGEKRSLISGIVTDGGRIAGRCGLGAVMGAKKLKAVAVRGKRHVPIADPAAFEAHVRAYRQLFRRQPAAWVRLIPRLLLAVGPLLRRLKLQFTGGPLQMVVDNFRLYGTASGTALLVALGDTPIRNWSGDSLQDFTMARAANLSDEAVIRDKIRPYACHSCPLGCGAIIRLPGGGTGHRPEYETLAAFGPTVMNDDLDTVVACNEICNLSGLDTISTGVAVAFAMECYQRGWLPPGLAGELDLGWGNRDAIVELTRRIADRQTGLGDWLADGVRRASEILAPEGQEAAMHAGGQELPMHRSLYQPGVGVGYQVDPAPGRHTASNSGISDAPALTQFLRWSGRELADRHDYSAKGAELAITMPLLRAMDSLGLCMFILSFGQPPLLEWLRAATGWEVDEAEYLRTGRRIQALRHAFNAREGILPDQVTLPARERGEPPQQRGPLAGLTLDTEAMRRGYYESMGIDPLTGWPARATAVELGLDSLLNRESA